jgi:hypothetical protein
VAVFFFREWWLDGLGEGAAAPAAAGAAAPEAAGDGLAWLFRWRFPLGLAEAIGAAIEPAEADGCGTGV